MHVAILLLEALHTCDASDSSFTDEGRVKTSWLANNTSLVYRHTTPTSVQVLEDVQGHRESGSEKLLY